MKIIKIQNMIFFLIFGTSLFFIGCSDVASTAGSVAITINSPYMQELRENEMYSNVQVVMKFTGADGWVKECKNVNLDPETLKLTGSCGEVNFGVYSYLLEYSYDGVVIAKSEGNININENNTSLDFTTNLDKSMDDDGDGFTNITEIIEGSDPQDKSSCPVIDISLSANTVSQMQINLEWNKPTCEASEYKIIRNEVDIATVSSITTYNDIGLDANTEYCYTVVAFDNDQYEINESDKICTTTLKFIDDTTGGITNQINLPPDVIGIIGVASGDETTFTASVSDDAPITEIIFEWLIDGISLSQNSSQITINNPDLGSEITLIITDAKGAFNSYTIIWGTIPKRLLK